MPSSDSIVDVEPSFISSRWIDAPPLTPSERSLVSACQSARDSQPSQLNLKLDQQMQQLEEKEAHLTARLHALFHREKEEESTFRGRNRSPYAMKDNVDEPSLEIEAEMVSLSPHRAVKYNGEELSSDIEVVKMPLSPHRAVKDDGKEPSSEIEVTMTHR